MYIMIQRFHSFPERYQQSINWNDTTAIRWVMFYCHNNDVSISVKHITLQWRYYEHDGVSNHQPHDCLLNRLFRQRSKKTSYLRVTGLCDGNSPVTGEFPAQRARNAENVSIRWRHYDMYMPSSDKDSNILRLDMISSEVLSHLQSYATSYKISTLCCCALLD